MRHALVVLIACIIFPVACKPVANTKSDPPPSAGIETSQAAQKDEIDWEAEFRRVHGTAYDQLSKVDREKMETLKAGRGASQETEIKTETSYINIRKRVIKTAESLIGLRETHGPNRSPMIDEMNRLTGVPLGSAWCASANAWIYDRAKVPGNWPRSAWSPDWVRSPTWTRANGGKEPLPGDAFGIWFAQYGRVAHTGLVEQWGESVLTLEGNTSPTGAVGEADRNGDGYYRKRRLASQIYSVRDWIASPF